MKHVSTEYQILKLNLTANGVLVTGMELTEGGPPNWTERLPEGTEEVCHAIRREDNGDVLLFNSAEQFMGILTGGQWVPRGVHQ